MARPMPRRRFLLLALGAAAVPLAQACAPQTPAPSQPTAPPAAGQGAPTAGAATGAKPAAQPTTPPKTDAGAKPAAVKRGGSLVSAQSWTYPTFDVHLSSQAVAPAYMMLYDSLLRYELVDPATGKFELRPGLAESWENAGDKAIVMKLRKGVKFHDGSDFNAEVAKWNIERMMKHDQSFAKPNVQAIESVDVLDSHTIRINLKAPSASALLLLSGGGSAITGMVSKAAVEKLGEDGFARQPSGTGPMKFSKWVQDDRVILTRNEDYWRNGVDGKPLPYLDEGVFRFVPDPTVSLVELRAGNVHLVENIEGKDIAQVTSDPNLVFWELTWSGPIFFLLGFNVEKGPFADVRLRKAALHAIDREAMAQVFGFGHAKAHYYPYWTPGMLGYNDQLPKYEYNPEKVKQLLAEAGVPNGFDTTLMVIAREPENKIGEMAAEMWTKLGIRTKLESLERLAWIDRSKAMNFEASFWRFSTQAVDPDLNSRTILSDASANWSQFKDPEIDRLMAEGRSTHDVAKRQQIYEQVQRIIYDKAYLGSGYYIPENKVYRKEVKGLTVQFIYADISEVWLDK